MGSQEARKTFSGPSGRWMGESLEVQVVCVIAPSRTTPASSEDRPASNQPASGWKGEVGRRGNGVGEDIWDVVLEAQHFRSPMTQADGDRPNQYSQNTSRTTEVQLVRLTRRAGWWMAVDEFLQLDGCDVPLWRGGGFSLRDPPARLRRAASARRRRRCAKYKKLHPP